VNYADIYFRNGSARIPIAHSVRPLAQAAEAHRLLEGRETVGKLLLKT
jgi:NADPH:quinone reductase-like Zn-dependent oxidoreductase